MRAQFDEYIGAVPASRIDLDGLVLQSRQVRRRRRATVAGLATVMVLVTVLTAGTAALRRQAGQPVTAVPTATATTSPSPQTSLDRSDRLLAALVAALHREAPEVSGAETVHQYLESCPPGKATPGVDPCNPADAERMNELLYQFRGQLSTPTAHCTLYVVVARDIYDDPASPPVNAMDASERAAAAELGRAPQRGPGGEAIYLLSNAEVQMTRPDATRVGITCSQPAPVFTREQLSAIGRAPDLHF